MHVVNDRYALEKGASFKVVEMEEEEEEWRKHGDTGDRGAQDNSSARNYSLFAFPGECNFSGAKYSLEWVTRYHNKRGEDKTCVALPTRHLPFAPRVALGFV
jgi:hypothetical protein